MSNINLKDRIRGSLIGGAIGDALGYQVEFEPFVQPKQVTKYQDDRGIFSDDTQMTLFTANALLWRETRWNIRGVAPTPPEAIYLGYLDWLKTQQRTDFDSKICWIRDLPELNVLRDPGNTCLEALASGKQGTFGESINDSKGCGAIMRLAPIGFVIRSDKVGDFSARSATLTHGHPLAALSAFVLGEIIHFVGTADYSIEKAIKTAISDVKNWEPEVYIDSKKQKIDWSSEKAELITLLEQAIELTKTNRAISSQKIVPDQTSIAQQTGASDQAGATDQAAIESLGTGWVAEEALAIAIYSALRYENDFESAIICAVNHGGDSDSTGAITGNIIGAKLGYSQIPDYYKQHLESADLILELADDLASGAPINRHSKENKNKLNANGEITDENWLKKYLYITHL